MNDHYIPPVLKETSAERVPASSEYVPEPRSWDEIVGTIEGNIEKARQGANEETIPRYGVKEALKKAVRKLIVMPPMKEKSLEDRLIDVEASIGGHLLPASNEILSQRFWLDKERDWHYEVVDGNGVAYARYQVRGGELIKSVGATTLPLAEGERESFIVWVQRYYQALATGLYQDSIVVHEMRGLDEELDYLLSVPDVNKVLSKDDYELSA